MDQMAHVAREQGKTLVPLNDDLTPGRSGLRRLLSSPTFSHPRSPPGNDSAMIQESASNGCSQPRKPAPKWAAPTQAHRRQNTLAERVIITTPRY